MSISLTGLASGLDTAGMIQVLLTNESIAIDRLKTSKSNLQSEQRVFQTINTSLAALRDAAAELRLSSNFNLTTGKSSNENVVKISTPEGAATGSYNIEVEQIAKSHSIRSANIDVNGSTLSASDFVIKDKDGNPLLSIDKSNLENMNDGEALDYIKNQINQKNMGISASVITVDDSTKVLVLTSQSTGEENQIKLGTTAGKGAFTLDGDTLSNFNFTTTQAAQDAIIHVNNIEIQRSSNTITGVIEGATISIVSEGNSIVDISRDADKVAAKIQKFVDAYNDVVTTVRNNLTKPEDSAKMNPLQGDSMLREIQNNLYNIFNSIAGSQDGYKMMSELGLEIDKGITSASLMTGKITFDKSQFAEKFNADPNATMALFMDKDDGIMFQLDEQIRNWTSSADGLLTTKIKGYNAEIEFVDDRLIAANDRLVMKQAQLQKQFTAMEVALAELKSQQNWMTSVLASLTASAAATNKN